MLISTFDDDLIGLREFSLRLLRFIDVEHHFVQGSLVIGVNSQYGSGKTTFFGMLQDDLQKGESVIGPVTVVPLNAWESDFFGDPLFAIVSALVGRIGESGKQAAPIVSAAKDLGWFATAIGSQMVSKFTGIDPVAAGDVVEKKKADRKPESTVPMDSFSSYQKRKIAMEKLKDALMQFVTESDSKIIFLVDELDRCRPDYAISYLETIKHIFDIPGATFILAADRQHLQNSARTAFGADLDFDEYYRKFVHREVTLPSITEDAYRRFAEHYSQYFLEREGVRCCFMGLERDRIQNIATLIAALKLTPRQIQECFRILGHLLSTQPEKRAGLLPCFAVGALAMSALRIGRPEFFHCLGTQSLSPNAAMKLLKDDLKLKNSNWWFTLFAIGEGIAFPEQNLLEGMKSVGIISKELQEFPQEYSEWFRGWGHFEEHRLSLIYEKIEQLMHW